MKVRHHSVLRAIASTINLWLWNRKLSRQYQAIMKASTQSHMAGE